MRQLKFPSPLLDNVSSITFKPSSVGSAAADALYDAIARHTDVAEKRQERA